MNVRKKVIFLGALYQAGTVIMIGVSLWLLVLNINHAKASANWPQTNGVVTCSVNSQQVYDQNKIGNIWYQYEVGGKTYRSDRVSFFETDELNKHPEGELVTVFYNPLNIQDACLVKDVSKAGMWKFYFLSFALLWAIGMISYMLYVLVFAKLSKGKCTAAEKVAAANVATSLGSLW